MTNYPAYPNPPIIEAICDIQAALPQDITVEHLRSLHAKIEGKFPEKKERVSFQGSLRLDLPPKQALTTGSSKVDGYLFRSPIEGKVMQSRLDGFTFNKLKPYESWRSFSAEAREMWGYYCDIAHPIKITRISLRYINKITIPLKADTKDYFLTGPEISRSLPQAFRSFFMRLEVPNEKDGSSGVINMASQPPDSSGFPVVFDIDAIRTMNIGPSDLDLWTYFEELRNFKNRLFFESLTDQAKEMFK